ncbi:MAG: hypothetical protein QOK04_643 [Solirubrobacteraceae bacterium]|jgi:hypothetical protein|nr:hypothetical protein [Solirubrobacteraceae bacterium]
MFSGLFQTLLVPTRTPAEQETDAAAANGSPVVDAPAPAEGGVTSPPTPASELPLDGSAGNGAVTVERDTRANPVGPAAIALAAILAGVGVVLAYPGHHHRTTPHKAVVPPTTTVTGPARGAIAPLASAAGLTLDLTNAKAVGAIVPILKKRTAAKPAAHPATGTGGTSPSGAASGSGSTGGTAAGSGGGKSQTPSKNTGSAKPAGLTAKGEWLPPSGDAQTARFSFARSSGKGKVDQIQLVVMSGDKPLRILSWEAPNKTLPGPATNKCTTKSKRGSNDMLVCKVSLTLGNRYSVTVHTAPSPGIDTVGWLYGRIDGKVYPKKEIG